MRLSNSFCLLLSLVLAFCALPPAFALEAPKLVEKDGRWALFVDGRPYLILGGQIHNSSAWPSELPAGVDIACGPAREHRRGAGLLGTDRSSNGQFDFDNVDQL